MTRLTLAPALGLVALLVAGAWFGGLREHASFAALGQQQGALRAFAVAQPVAAAAAYVLAYAVFVTLCLPVGALMSVTGGLVFGAVAGSALAVCGAGLGGVGVFLLARPVLGPMMARRAGDMMARLRPRLQRDGFSYLLAIRLLPVVPFWLTNLAPALAGMRLAPFAAATVLGITPATIVFVSLGAGLGDSLAEGRQPDLGVLLGPRVLLPLAGLAVLSLTPVAWRAWRRPRHG